MATALRLSALLEVVNLIPEIQEWNRALAERHGVDLQRKISSSTVAVCGLGGLGSNIAIALARSGIGKLILIDYDRVDITNLHRQQYKANQIGMYKTDALRENLREIAPYLVMEAHNAYLTENNAIEFIKEADIICEAFDDPRVKAMLTNLVLSELPDKYLVAASGMAGLGSANSIRTRKITKRFYLCGDEISDVDTEGSLISSRVMLCASHQAHTVLRILADQFET